MADAISQIQTHQLDLLFEMIKCLREVHQNETFESIVLKDGKNKTGKNGKNGKNVKNGKNNNKNNKNSSKANEYDYDGTSAQECAHSILEKVYQADVLISNLPQIYETEEEQMNQIQQLIVANEKMNEKLNAKKIEAQKAQKKLTNRLKMMTNTIHGTK